MPNRLVSETSPYLPSLLMVLEEFAEPPVPMIIKGLESEMHGSWN